MRKLQDEKVASKVRTIDVRENAITGPVSSFTSGSLSITKLVENTIQECSVSVTGEAIFITCSFVIIPDVDTDICDVLLYRGTTKIYESGALIVASVAGSYSLLICFNITN